MSTTQICNFTGAFAPSKWSFNTTGGNYFFSPDNKTLTINGSQNGTNVNTLTELFLSINYCRGFTISFDYSYSTMDISGPSADPFGYLDNLPLFASNNYNTIVSSIDDNKEDTRSIYYNGKTGSFNFGFYIESDNSRFFDNISRVVISNFKVTFDTPYTTRSFLLNNQPISDMRLEQWRFVDYTTYSELQYWDSDNGWRLHSTYTIADSTGGYRFTVALGRVKIIANQSPSPPTPGQILFSTNYKANYWRFESIDNQKLYLKYSKSGLPDSWLTHCTFSASPEYITPNCFYAGNDQVIPCGVTNMSAIPYLSGEPPYGLWTTRVPINPPYPVIVDPNYEFTEVKKLRFGINVFRWRAQYSSLVNIQDAQSYTYNEITETYEDISSYDDVIVYVVNSPNGLFFLTPDCLFGSIIISPCVINLDFYDFSDICSSVNILNLDYINNICCIAVHLRTISEWIHNYLDNPDKVETVTDNLVIRTKWLTASRNALTVAEQIDTYVEQLTIALNNGQTDLSLLVNETTTVLNSLNSLLPCIQLKKKDGTVITNWFNYMI